jgi:hypothetical protein
MKYALLTAAALGLTVMVAHAEQTWTGAISDTVCGAKHESGGEMGEAMNDHDCTLACVKGGSTFVFVTDGRVYKIANQDFADVRTHAGESVKLRGEMKGDTITVSGIQP